MGKPIKHRGRWRIRWIDHEGKRRSEVYDDYRTAVAKLGQHHGDADEVRKGLKQPPPLVRTFDDLCDFWIDKKAPSKRSGNNDASIIGAHLREAFKGLRVLEFTSEKGVAAMAGYAASKSDLGGKTIYNHMTLLSAMLHIAHELGWISRVPHVPKPKLAECSFSYLRTRGEIERFLGSAKEEDNEVVFYLYAAACYTGLREGELAALEPADIDFESRLITVARSFDGPTKSEKVRYVPILDPLLPLLREWRLRCGSRYVFPNANGGRLGKSARIFQETLHRVLDRAEFPRSERNGRVRHYIVFHDLRHTFASSWVAGGGDIFRLQKILGHSDIKQTMRYAHLSPTAYAEDYGRLGHEVPAAARGNAEVIPLRIVEP